MAQGQLEEIRLFFINFQDSLPINYTTLKLVAYLEVALGNTKYHHQDSGIPKTVFIPVLLDHGSRTTGGDSFIFYKLSGQFAHKLHSFEVGHATHLEVALGNTKYHHHDSGIPNTASMSVLLDNGSRTNERDPSIYNNLSGEFYP
jgi:hypothetical protein